MKELAARAREIQPAALSLLERLVGIDTGTGQGSGIERAARMLEEEYARLGFVTEAVPAGEYGRHLVARRPGRGRPLLILGHLDTVHPPGAARPPVREGDRLSGPGVYDCKGGLAVCLMACELWSAHGWPASPLTVVINADEEIGSPSSRPLIEAEAARSRAALVVEPAPAPGAVIASRRGIGRYVLRVFGRAAHTGADRESGANAILALAHKIIALERVNEDAPGCAVTVGTVSGGVRPNVVPAYAQAEIDLRVARPEQVAAAEAAIKAAAALNPVRGARYSLEGGITRPPMPADGANEALFEAAREIGRGLGLDLAAVASGGGSDGNFCAALGIPTLDGLGPGGAGAHGEKEYILTSTLAPRAALLCGLGRKIGEMA
ncbi:MAG: M20 family metallopeptidase [Patescibacteria group bacterium]